MNITIYGKPMCSYCTMAKNLLDREQIPYEYKELDRDFVREDLLTLAPGARSYPQIVINGEVVGGFNEMVTYLRTPRGLRNDPSLLTEG